MRWLQDEGKIGVSDYDSLWSWSVANHEDFWKSLLSYFSVMYEGQDEPVTNGMPMPETVWFEGLSLNYAEHIFRNKTAHQPAIIFRSESGTRREISWQDLALQVSAVRHHLEGMGIVAGDRVAAFLPSTPEATIAFLAANSLGAVWSSCSPDFGTKAVIDRFAQIEPKVLFAVDQYVYSGKTFDKTGALTTLASALPSVKAIILISTKGVRPSLAVKTYHWQDITEGEHEPLEFTRVPFSHPIWILYSSGTTGIPKAIVHSHGGILLEHLKYGSFHNDFHAGEKCFWYTTTGWMMWNYIHGCLLSGGTLVLYDGNPAYPNLDALWNIAAAERINHFGTSASFILANMKAGANPGSQFELGALRSIGSTGSTLPPEAFEWIYGHVKRDVWLSSMSGGTDVCSAFVGGNPTLPVYAGEIQCRALGCNLEAWDESGVPVVDKVGEMVITEPMPSMPVFFWNDPSLKRYRESYFEMFPGVWRHGDWICITPHHGVIIYGRSDATLNRGGIRIGTSEIYSGVDHVREVKDSLIICVEKSGGAFWMPLFVVMQDGFALTAEIKESIVSALRREYSPRHIPDTIIQVPDIPYTISGKKTETPVKKIFMGVDPAKAVNRGVLKNPESMDYFIEMARTMNP